MYFDKFLKIIKISKISIFNFFNYIKNFNFIIIFLKVKINAPLISQLS